VKIRRPALWRRRDGNVTVMLAGSLVMLFGTSALGIDTAAMFLEKRRLQGIADAAALSAAGDPTASRSRAEAAVRANAHGDARIVTTTLGSFTPTRRSPSRTGSSTARCRPMRCA
jgi:Flp pilus assembly protein TadG